MAVRNVLAFVLALGPLGSATAQPSVADKLSTIEAQLLLLKKTEELDRQRATMAGLGSGGVPKIVSVGASASGMVARLLLPSGAVENFREGDPIRDGMRISAITGRGVLVSLGDGKKVRSMPLEYVVPQSAGAGGGGAAGGPTGPIPRELLPDAPVVSPGRMPVPAPSAAPAQPTAAPAAPSAASPAAPAPAAQAAAGGQQGAKPAGK